MSSLWHTQDDIHHPISQSEGSQTERRYVSRWTKGHVTIDVLPDDVLLEIFDCCFYIDEDEREDSHVVAWHTLVHVSRNWRCVVFNSTRRLNLRLLCSERTPVREMLAIWPPLPIIIRFGYSAGNENGDNIIAALEHHDRVCDIKFHNIPSSLLEKVLVAIQGPSPFPALESLYVYIWKRVDGAPLVSDSFLGGSAPHLRHLQLNRISFQFPVLRKLLLSATDLVDLTLSDIPHSGYFSPEAIVTCLSALTRLEWVRMGFESPLSRPSRENRRPPPPPRTLLPALRFLDFTGVSEYLEDLVARIDAPLLNHLIMNFFHQLIFDIPQLAQFISCRSRTQWDEVPKGANISFYNWRVDFRLTGPFADELELNIPCKHLDWQVSALEQVFRLSFPQALIPMVEDLFIDGVHWGSRQDDIDNSQWLDLFHPFIGVKNLFLSRDLAPLISLVLQELVGERVYDVFPALQSINLEEGYLEGVVSEGIGHFVDARHHSSHPVAIVWEIEED